MARETHKKARKDKRGLNIPPLSFRVPVLSSIRSRIPIVETVPGVPDRFEIPDNRQLPEQYQRHSATQSSQALDLSWLVQTLKGLVAAQKFFHLGDGENQQRLFAITE
jgi:hypothetical protein